MPDGLTRSQQAAVTHPGGPLLVVAGAGTGKTRTLTSRFAWLVEQGVPADAVLALTFSSPAASEMRERLEALLEDPYEELHVSTFHSFCTRLLQDEALEAGVDPFLSPVTPADRLALLLERLDDLTLRHHETRGNPAPLLASFVSRIDRLKDEMVSAEDYARYAERLAGAPDGDAARAHAERELEFGRLYADHDRLLSERGALDFGDLILRAFRLLHECPHVRQRAEVRDVLAWLRALADPGDSGAVVRALSRPPVELRSVDVARLTQLARRRKLDMPSAGAAALEGPQLSEEGRH